MYLGIIQMAQPFLGTLNKLLLEWGLGQVLISVVSHLGSTLVVVGLRTSKSTSSFFPLKSGNFFTNLGSILLFAIIGTTISALVVGGGVYLLGLADLVS